MTRLHSLKISNFRGIKSYEQEYKDKDFICLVGRGDSGKTSILEAISFVLSPNWNIVFTDADFFNGNTEEQIEILAKIYDFPEKLMSESRFSGYCDFLNSQTQDIQVEPPTEGENWINLLTIKLIVNKNLEPKWYVTKDGAEDKEINSGDRATLNTFLVSDVTNNHFSWTKGNPLFSMLKQDGGEHNNEKTLEILRNAKVDIDAIPFPHLNDTTQKIKTASSQLGVNIDNLKTSIDFKEITTRDSKVSLHDDKVPFRLKGKGTKRIVSIAIQNELTKEGGITLIDEVEQGLEPDRVKHLVRTLNTHKKGQIFITTHSAGIIEEIDCDNLCLVTNKGGIVTGDFIPDGDTFQALMRACPEATYAKKVIVCEGKTEIGILMSLEINFSTNGTVFILGEGDNFTKRALALKELGKNVCVFCDSDKDEKLSPSKDDLKKQGIEIFDMTQGYNIEKEIFETLSWDSILKTVKYVTIDKNKDLGTLLSDVGIKGWSNSDTPENRDLLFKCSIFKDDSNPIKVKDKSWFKRIDHGRFLGELIKENLDAISGSKLYECINGISKWVENDS